MNQESQAKESRRAKNVGLRNRAWRSIVEIHGAILPKLDNDLQEESGIDVNTYDALLHIFEAGEHGIRMVDLASAVIISKSGITSLVDRLEASAHVQRNADSDDRRAIRITLTPSGEQTFRAAARVHLAGIEEYFVKLLSDDEARAIAETLERIHVHGETQS